MSGAEWIEVVWLTEDDEGGVGVWRDPDNARRQIAQDRAAELPGVYEWVNDPDRTHELLLHDDEPTGLTLRMMLVADAAPGADPVTAEQQQDGAAEDVTAFLDAWEADRGFGNAIRGGNGDIPYLFATDLRAVLAERAARTARVAELEGEREAAAGFVAVWHDTANVQHEVDEIRCQSCRACVAGPLKSTTTLADLAVLAGRHECLPRMAATETEES